MNDSSIFCQLTFNLETCIYFDEISLIRSNNNLISIVILYSDCKTVFCIIPYPNGENNSGYIDERHFHSKTMPVNLIYAMD